jgi:hypothetical protein
LLEIEQRSLPVREYLTKHVFPHITEGILKVTQIRPQDPVKYLSDYIFCQAHCSSSSDSSNHMELDEEVVKEFKSLAKCD